MFKGTSSLESVPIIVSYIVIFYSIGYFSSGMDSKIQFQSTQMHNLIFLHHGYQVTRDASKQLSRYFVLIDSLHELVYINPFIPEFLTGNIPSSNLDTLADANRSASQKMKIECQTVNPSEIIMSHLIRIYTFCKGTRFGLQG